MEHDTAGDPITGLKWTRKTTEKIAGELRAKGIDVCANTVGKLVKKLDFSLRHRFSRNEKSCSIINLKRLSKDIISIISESYRYSLIFIQ